MSLVKKFATVGGATLGSRIFGFVRESLACQQAEGDGCQKKVFHRFTCAMGDNDKSG